GRRRFLIGFAALSAIGGLAVATYSSPVVLAVASFIGMLNGVGKDRGSALAVEQAILPSTVPDERRTFVFSIYNVLQSAGAASGALMAAIPSILAQAASIPEVGAMRATMVGYSVLMAATGILYAGLGDEVEVYSPPGGFRVSPETRSVLIKLSALFSIDSIGGGFITQALVSLYFVEHFGVRPSTVGALFFAAAIANAVSQLLAPPLAKRIGLVNTMVFTHMPANALMMFVAIAPNFLVAAILVLGRECLVQMDVPARQSYVMAVVRPEERTFASGATGLVRLAGWAVAPGFAGLIMQTSMGAPLVIGPGMKIVYDLLLYRSFRHLKPPEERSATEDERGAATQS
ncbi:MAG TPA: MFS transporter, partial [Candidatus Binataceae bacterium]|nr:MFS transporter [Candidatus Binataceae bacterium]